MYVAIYNKTVTKETLHIIQLLEILISPSTNTDMHHTLYN